MTHLHVPHPRDFLNAERRAATWINSVLTSVLGSNLVFAACFIVPLAAIPASDTVKLIIGLFFSNWFQAWALPVLQKGQQLAEQQRSAKAAADHVALTHIAQVVDEIAAQSHTH